MKGWNGAKLMASCAPLFCFLILLHVGHVSAEFDNDRCLQYEELMSKKFYKGDGYVYVAWVNSSIGWDVKMINENNTYSAGLEGQVHTFDDGYPAGRFFMEKHNSFFVFYFERMPPHSLQVKHFSLLYIDTENMKLLEPIRKKDRKQLEPPYDTRTVKDFNLVNMVGYQDAFIDTSNHCAFLLKSEEAKIDEIFYKVCLKQQPCNNASVYCVSDTKLSGTFKNFLYKDKYAIPLRYHVQQTIYCNSYKTVPIKEAKYLYTSKSDAYDFSGKHVITHKMRVFSEADEKNLHGCVDLPEGHVMGVLWSAKLFNDKEGRHCSMLHPKPKVAGYGGPCKENILKNDQFLVLVYSSAAILTFCAFLLCQLSIIGRRRRNAAANNCLRFDELLTNQFYLANKLTYVTWVNGSYGWNIEMYTKYGKYRLDIAGEVYNYGAYPAGRIFLTSEMEFYVFFFAKISPYKLYGRRYQLLEVDK